MIVNLARPPPVFTVTMHDLNGVLCPTVVYDATKHIQEHEF